MQKTDLNVSPYYDDFSEDSLFHRVLFRPAYSVQARELTQMQTILQNQIERIGSHFFKEGAVVIPGQTGFDITYSYVKLQATFTDFQSVAHTTENFRTSLVGTKLTGATSGVIAKVVNTIAGDSTDDLTIFVKYESSGTVAGGTTNTIFANGEALLTDTAISYTSGSSTVSIAASSSSTTGQVALTAAAAAAGTGSSASVQKGIFYIRGSFVQATTQTIILDKYSSTPSYRIGFSVTESLITPEEETGLLDNATGSTNFAAKGAHRLKFTLTLVKKALGTADDSDFIELLSVKEGLVQSQVRATEYSVLEDTLARRTHDESGDYIVRGFDIDMREHYNDGLNDGVFLPADGGDTTKIAIGLSPGKAYVRGYEVGTLAQTFIPLSKARSTAFVQNNATTFSAGNYVTVENVYGTPDITSDSNDSKPFKEVELRDQRMPITHVNDSTFAAGDTTLTVFSTERMPISGTFYIQIEEEILQCTAISGLSITVVRGYLGTADVEHADDTPVYVWGLDHITTVSPWHGLENSGLARRAKTVGVARTRAFEVGTAGTITQLGAHPRTSTFQHYLFDVRMLTKLTVAAAKKFTATNFLHNGARIKGSSSGATGIVYIAPQDVAFSMAACATSSGTANLLVPSTAGLEVGMHINQNAGGGTNIADGTYILSITDGTHVVMSANEAAGNSTSSLTLTFGNAASQADGAKYGGTVGAGGSAVDYGGTTFHVIQTTGTFTTSDTITSNFAEDLAAGSVTLSAVKYYNFADAHSIYGANNGVSGKHYAADLSMLDRKKLTGTASGASITVTGINTQFTSDFKVGDLFEIDNVAGNAQRMEVKAIASDVSLTVVETIPVTISNGIITRVRAKIEEQEELVMLSKLPKQAVKTLKATELNNKVDTTLRVRRQNTLPLTGGIGSFSLPEGETFVSFNEDDYVISLTEASGSTNGFAAGTVLSPTKDAGTCKVEITSQGFTMTLSGGGTGSAKVTYTAQIATANEKTKTLQPMSELNIPAKGISGAYANTGIFGTNCTDEEISLMKADVFKVHGIYMSANFTDAAVPPRLTYQSKSGETTNTLTSGDIFQPGAKVVGSNGAIARIISGSYTGSGGVGGTTQIASFSYLTTKTFTDGTTLTSEQNTATSGTLTISSSGVAAGDENILSNYQVDTGMRDTFYDLGSVARKAGQAPPTGRLLIVFDYFTHGAGNYFSVDSYPVGTSATSITYDEIPLYSAQRVDPDTISPTGEYDLRDALDFRPRIGDYNQGNVFNHTGTPAASANSITPFSFAMRSGTVMGFESGSASLIDVPKTDDTFISSFNYYLPQNAALWLDSEGEFKTVVGAAAENPENPVALEDAMQIAEFRIPQYTFAPSDIGMRRLKNRRFTMRDIGKINERVENLEYYSQLNMLEKDTESYQIQDADGLDRFKNGFIVDNFTGHSVGDALHPDYQNSMDMANGILRPEFKHRMLTLEESVSTDAARTSAGYRKTGDLLTLPYTEVEMINQPYASRIENVNPFNVIAWIGSISLDPSSDIWKDTNRMPNLVINREGNYDSFIARNGGSAVNTVWNEWETFWTGEKSNSVQWRDTSWATARKQVPFRRVMERTVTTTTTKQSRSGVRTEITPRIDYESKGDKVVSTEVLPYCRAKTVNFTAKVFKPMTRLFAFFDNVDVTQYCKPAIPYSNTYNALNGALTSGTTAIVVNSTGIFPTSGSITIDDEIITYTDKTSTTFGGTVLRAQSGTTAAIHDDNARVYKTPVDGDPLITGATGKCAGAFSIPDPNVSGNPAFKVGERIFRLTSDAANGVLSGDTETAGETTYYAKGLLDNIQETIIATRNADVNKVSVNDTRVVTSTRASDHQIGWWDPVAQSFLIDTKGGAFVTSVNVYFQSKSETVPCQCQMRTMKNGYPTTTILPFGTASAEPSEIQVSEDASLPTLFTFPAPIYLQQDIEYCFVIMANTQDYMIWLSHMGDVEIGGNRTISDQPYAGVLFKSQNASTWSAAQMEDLKFSINRASFSLSSGVVTLQNTGIENVALGQSPIVGIPGTKKVKVRHLNHGMYAGSVNNVTISGITGTISTSGGTYNLGFAQSGDEANNALSSGVGTGMNGTFTALAEVGLDHYIIDLGQTHSSNHAVPFTAFDEAKVTGGATGLASENYIMDTGKAVLQLMEVGGSDVTTKIRTTSATSASGTDGVAGGSETSFNLVAGSSAVEVSPNENINFAEPVMIASTINETNEMTGNKSFEVLATLSTGVENITPVIDTQRMGMICVQNRLNNINVNTDYYTTDTLGRSTVFSDGYSPKTAAEGDANAAVYITRKISLANASTSLKVMFDAIVFSSAYVDVFYKVLKSDDTTAFESIEWTEMTIDKAVSESKDYGDFRERTYEVAGLEGFIAFAVKIVMRGTKSTEPPFIKDFRTIALAL